MTSAALNALMRGLGQTVLLSVAALVISTVLAVLLLPAALTSRYYIRLPLRTYVWIGRALPPLTFLYSAFYLLPSLGIRTSVFMAALIAFVIFSTAYNVEILRSAIEAVPGGQHEATKSLGVPYLTAMWRIIIPQGIVIATPTYISNATMVIKETSLASAIGVLELTGVTNRQVQLHPSEALTLYTLTGVFYFVIVSLILLIQWRLESWSKAKYGLTAGANA